MDIRELLEYTIQREASDLHLLVGIPPTIRVDGQLMPVPNTDKLQGPDLENLIFSLLKPEQKTLFLANLEYDFSYAIPKGRFRANIYFQQSSIAGSFRHIPSRIKTIEELNLPGTLHEFTTLRQGFILVTGPTGHGKSTTLAALINEINQSQKKHIITIEDPVEYVYPEGQSLVSQREMNVDSHSWDLSLRSVLREDPDVVLIGEMRDFDTIAAALTIAETGHLVFATLHTNSTAQSIDRVVDVFPSVQQAQVRMQLANSLAGILSQRLVPAIGGGRVPATELLLSTAATRTAIRDGKTHLIDNIILTSREQGMMLLENSLIEMVRQGRITREVAQSYAIRSKEFTELLMGSKK